MDSIPSRTDSVKRSDAEYLSLASKVKDGAATDADKAELQYSSIVKTRILSNFAYASLQR